MNKQVAGYKVLIYIKINYVVIYKEQKYDITIAKVSPKMSRNKSNKNE